MNKRKQIPQSKVSFRNSWHALFLYGVAVIATVIAYNVAQIVGYSGSGSCGATTYASPVFVIQLSIAAIVSSIVGLALAFIFSPTAVRIAGFVIIGLCVVGALINYFDASFHICF